MDCYRRTERVVSLHRFFVPPFGIKGNQVSIEGEEARHLYKVLRLKPGNSALIFDGEGREYTVRLLNVESERVIAEITGENKSGQREPLLQVTLVQGVSKGEKMDFIVQKAIELGVSCIHPVVSEYGVVKLSGDKAEQRVDRWRKIAREACKQSGRAKIPEIKSITGLNTVMEVQKDIPGIFFYEAEYYRGLKAVLQQNAALFRHKGVFIYIGPEGGFSPAEAALARRQGLFFAGLGPRILRTETAGLAALTAVLYELGDIGGLETDGFGSDA